MYAQASSSVRPIYIYVYVYVHELCITGTCIYMSGACMHGVCLYICVGVCACVDVCKKGGNRYLHK